MKDLFSNGEDFKYVNIIGYVKADRDMIMFPWIKIAWTGGLMFSAVHFMIGFFFVLILVLCLLFFICKYWKVKKILKQEIWEIDNVGDMEMKEVKKYGKMVVEEAD